MPTIDNIYAPIARAQALRAAAAGPIMRRYWRRLHRATLRQWAQALRREVTR